jgi:succinate dehydrogenase/fumarate reductase flavoprotein subunit
MFQELKKKEQKSNKKEEVQMSEKETKKGVGRREFLKGAAVGAGALALAGLGAKEAKAEPKPWLPAKWDYEADVVVVGAGFAGQAVVIEADRAGASVLMLEKANEKEQGGNSRVCGQGFIAPPKAIWEDYFAYLKMATAGQGFPVPDEHLRFYIEESSKNLEWFAGLGIKVVEGNIGGGRGAWIPFYPQFPGAEAIAKEAQFYWVDPAKGPGRDWYALEDYILQRKGIKKMLETPAKRLVQDPLTKEILGVVAEKAGKEIFVKAKRAVCICAGGYEYNPQMIRDFQGISKLYSQGSPHNTGETIKMCWEIGADIRNMSAIAAPSYLSAGILPGYKSAIPIAPNLSKGGFIMVGANNKRFRDEYRTAKTGWQSRGINTLEHAAGSTGQIIENGVYVRDKHPMPMHYIFDEAARVSGPLFGSGMSWSNNIEGYKCSPDNSAELAKGWIIKGAHIRDLATKIGRDPDALEATVKKWNADCAAGKDTQFDTGDPTIVPYQRPKERLVPIVGGPLYAVQVYPSTLNTQGGMTRNIKSQVMDIRGNPIPRLYSAGENGDIWTWIYQCMSNVGGGCFGYGRIAGQNAAKETPWDATT